MKNMLFFKNSSKLRYKNLLRKNKNQSYDKIFLICVLALTLYGSIMVFTSGYAYAKFRYNDPFYFIKRQIIWVILGILIMLLTKNIDITFVKMSSFYLYALTLILLILTLVIGFVGNGAQRWISIGPITFQPSEIAKFTMVVMLAKYYSEYEYLSCQNKSKKNALIYGTLIPFSIILLPVILVMLQKHLSCIIILGSIGVLVMVMSGINLRYLRYCMLAGIGGISYIAFFTDYTKERIMVWRNPEAYKLTGGWQTLQGLMAIGSGGFFGKGLTHGELKYCYVSEPANDMIFAILCEELGFFGAFIAISMFALLIYRGFKIAFHSPDFFERLLILGICSKIAIQTLLNIAVVTNTIPNTGISLPFFSYGGSSLLMLFFEMGIILSISKNAEFGK